MGPIISQAVEKRRSEISAESDVYISDNSDFEKLQKQNAEEVARGLGES